MAITQVPGNHLRVSHNGDNGTCRCQLTVWPNRGEGYIVCTNCNGNDAAGDLTNCVNRNNNGNTIGANIGCKTVDHVCDEIDNMLTNWTTCLAKLFVLPRSYGASNGTAKAEVGFKMSKHCCLF